ncbi:uncharacterized protein LOC62_07G009613 [Vanrija pseudolonga]|uniref:Uncharacterized protein n=1 Tax=Vanrija pseudolonga TaxID=143232 RepID=A0AAF0YL55_9TREE|nr:hypothetical protein LOC62_07G009613 [Vanrija pseudolonga]
MPAAIRLLNLASLLLLLGTLATMVVTAVPLSEQNLEDGELLGDIDLDLSKRKTSYHFNIGIQYQGWLKPGSATVAYPLWTPDQECKISDGSWPKIGDGEVSYGRWVTITPGTDGDTWEYRIDLPSKAQADKGKSGRIYAKNAVPGRRGPLLGICHKRFKPLGIQCREGGPYVRQDWSCTATHD